MKGRQRGRNGGKPRMHHQGGGGGGRNQNFDHNAGRMRGNAQQLLDKYLTLGRDASSQGDRVLAENYFQHADHYYRVVNARFEGQQNQNPNQQHRRFNGSQQGGYDGQDGQDGNDSQDGQGNYNDYNRSDIPPGPSQNLIPGGQQVLDQPSFSPSFSRSNSPNRTLITVISRNNTSLLRANPKGISVCRPLCLATSRSETKHRKAMLRTKAAMKAAASARVTLDVAALALIVGTNNPPNPRASRRKSFGISSEF